jgi:sulfite exporter TauE/SafE
MDAGFSAFLALCTPGVVQGSLLGGLFVAGAAGSVMHCVPMCGGFVLGQVSDRMARMPVAKMCEWQRLRAGLLLPYHAGRLVTYALLGAITASSAAVIGRAPWFSAFSSLLLVLAAALFLSQAAARLWPRRGAGIAAPQRWSLAIRGLASHLGGQSRLDGFLLGLLLGLLPCGFLYGALIAAAATSSPMMGAAAMLAFGAGTIPALMIVGIAGHTAGDRWGRFVRAACPPLLALNAVLLLGMAISGLRG